MRRRRKPTAVGMLQVGVAAVLVSVLVIFVMWYSEGLNRYKPGNATFRYVAGVRIDYSPDAVYRNKDSVVTVTDGEKQDTLGETPIIYEGCRRMTLPVDMLVMDPEQGLNVKRLNYFTDVVEEEGMIKFYKDGKSATVLGGFLYDGDNVYIFLEDATLYIGSKAVDLEPLSYVRVLYDQSVEYYNSADGSFQWVGCKDINVTAEASSGYMMDLGRDVLNVGQGEMLIYSAVQNLPVISMEN